MITRELSWWRKWLARWAAAGRPIMLNVEIQYRRTFRIPKGTYIDDSRAMPLTDRVRPG